MLPPPNPCFARPGLQAQLIMLCSAAAAYQRIQRWRFPEQQRSESPEGTQQTQATGQQPQEQPPQQPVRQQQAAAAAAAAAPRSGPPSPKQGRGLVPSRRGQLRGRGRGGQPGAARRQ